MNIKFDDTFNEDIGELCQNITTISFGFEFNQPITSLQHSNVEIIIFGNNFNQSIEVLGSCKRLQRVRFGAEFNQPIDALSACTELHSVRFWGKFNQPVDALAKCKKLKEFKVGSEFNQPVYDLFLGCPELTTISIPKDGSFATSHAECQSSFGHATSIAPYMPAHQGTPVLQKMKMVRQSIGQ